MATVNPTPSSDTPIAIKLALNNGENRRFKLTLRELGANTLPDKVSFHSLPPGFDPLPFFFSEEPSSLIISSDPCSTCRRLKPSSSSGFPTAQARTSLLTVTIQPCTSSSIELPKRSSSSVSKLPSLTSHHLRPIRNPYPTDCLPIATTLRRLLARLPLSQRRLSNTCYAIWLPQPSNPPLLSNHCLVFWISLPRNQTIVSSSPTIRARVLVSQPPRPHAVSWTPRIQSSIRS